MPLIKKIFLTSLILFLSINLYAEYLFLKDGAIIKGTIISETAVYVDFRNEEKKTVRYPRDQVMRVLYTELNMGKYFVQRRNGKVEIAYMVDEDRTTYTFRKDLYKPEEFTIKRADVLFMAERNPTGLKGEPETDRVSLEWLPSFEKMKHYNIYYKKKGGEYGSPLKSGKTSYVLKNLASNTEYTVKVTGFSGDGDETISSNEYTFVTKNRPPYPPGELIIENDDQGIIKLSWGPAVDPDGSVVEYLVYAIKAKERTLLARTKKTEFTVSAKIEFDKLTVTAVDEIGYESADAGTRVVGASSSGYTISFTGGIIYPMGNLGKLVETGYGGSLNLTKQNIYMPGLGLGVSAGFYYMGGQKDIGTDIQSVDRVYFAPLLINAFYRFSVTEKIDFVPCICFGAAYFDMPYEHFNAGYPENRHLKAFVPMTSAGFSLDYNISESLLICMRSDYGLLITESIFKNSFIRIEAAFGYRM